MRVEGKNDFRRRLVIQVDEVSTVKCKKRNTEKAIRIRKQSLGAIVINSQYDRSSSYIPVVDLVNLVLGLHVKGKES